MIKEDLMKSLRLSNTSNRPSSARTEKESRLENK